MDQLLLVVCVDEKKRTCSTALIEKKRDDKWRCLDPSWVYGPGKNLWRCPKPGHYQLTVLPAPHIPDKNKEVL
jgi:hypothetical protein